MKDQTKHQCVSDDCCGDNTDTAVKNPGDGCTDGCCDNKGESSSSGSGETSKGDDDDPESDACGHAQEHSGGPGLEDQVTTPDENHETAEYRIYGMDCPSCAASIEKSLQKVTGILQANVSYASTKLKVVADGAVPEDTIVSQVEKLGFETEPVHTRTDDARTYRVDGMDCGNCAIGIEKYLESLADVQSAQVHFSTGQMKVSHSATDDFIQKQVGKMGYQAVPLTERAEKKSKTPRGKFSGFSTLILSGVLIAAGFAGQLMETNQWLPITLFAIAIVLSGRKPVKAAFYSIKSRSLDMNVLMSMAAIGAAIIGEWLEGAMVVWLFSLGNVLQERSMEQTRQSIRDLMDMAPAKARVHSAAGLVEKAVEEIDVGDTIVIKPGDRIPLDGEITEGVTSINQATITGESIPVDKAEGDEVFAGTINENGALEVKVTKLVDDTTIAKITHMVEDAQEKRAPSQAFIDKFASIYTPVAFGIALLVMVAPPLLGLGAWGDWAYRGLALLILACPCALVISTPVAIVSAIGNAAKNGVLIKGGTFLEKAGAIKSMAFDKTGTLTEGKPAVTSVQGMDNDMDETTLLSIVYALESYSTHPIAQAIVTYAEERGISAASGTLFTNLAGRGVQATIDGTVYYAGNKRLFSELGLLNDDVNARLDELEAKGETLVIVGTDSSVLGLLSVADTIRPATVKAIDALKRTGVGDLVMLTGDQEGTARHIADTAHVSRYVSELLPEDKVNAVEDLQQEGHSVAMVGDGINDAPALATSDLGIAMGGAGTDTAMETADIVLMGDNLDQLPHTIRLSRKALRIIKQNIWFSILIKLAALVLIFPGWLTLWLAVISDTGAAIVVILNSLRLVKLKR